MKISDHLISVIVPAYNIKNYISDCLNSILAQDFLGYEIVIVNDGSTDDTPKICSKYAEKYNKIKVIHQKNAGLSAARNTGIKNAKGKYLAFIDGDDIIDKNFLSRLYQAIETTGSDIAICNFIEFSETVPTSAKASSEIKVVNRDEAVTALLIKQENRDVIACNKLYKKELFKNIKFPVGEIHEDNLTTYKLLAAASKVANIEDGLYFYRRHSGSITDTHELVLGLKMKERAAREAIEYFKSNQKLERAAEIALLLSEFAYLDNIASGKIHDQELWRETIKKINSSHKSYKTNPYLTKKLKLYLALLRFPSLYKLFRKIIH